MFFNLLWGLSLASSLLCPSAVADGSPFLNYQGRPLFCILYFSIACSSLTAFHNFFPGHKQYLAKAIQSHKVTISPHTSQLTMSYQLVYYTPVVPLVRTLTTGVTHWVRHSSSQQWWGSPYWKGGVWPSSETSSLSPILSNNSLF